MFVLGIDPGLTVTGYGVVRGGHPPVPVAAGVIRTPVDRPIGERLAVLHANLSEVIAQHRPDAVAVETVFTNRNLNTAIAVGRASGLPTPAAPQPGSPVPHDAPTAVT